MAVPLGKKSLGPDLVADHHRRWSSAAAYEL